eukprot:TRINITY_DN15351_c0_g2_i4.p3 TRINITY_DN15351_c0_g2~~TRINITY_DN15351_c0_g2_i4.p3  ORF type:complete len:127 (+),score=2.93 TRINITY_DN15351_c0_g2_i4:510-890(+)
MRTAKPCIMPCRAARVCLSVPLSAPSPPPLSPPIVSHSLLPAPIPLSARVCVCVWSSSHPLCHIHHPQDGLPFLPYEPCETLRFSRACASLSSSFAMRTAPLLCQSAMDFTPLFVPPVAPDAGGLK